MADLRGYDKIFHHLIVALQATYGAGHITRALPWAVAILALQAITKAMIFHSFNEIIVFE